MKKLIKTSAIIAFLMIITSLTAFAQEVDISMNTEDATQVQPIDIEENTENDKARIGGSVRGEWLADVYLQISDPQNGNIGVLMVTNCYSEVDRVLMGLYVDQLFTDEDGKEYWSQVDYKVFEFLPEDFESGKLINAIVDMEITGHDPGWYRLRSMHLVEKDDDSEFFSLETNAIEITDRFPLNSDEATPDEAGSGEQAE